MRIQPIDAFDYINTDMPVYRISPVHKVNRAYEVGAIGTWDSDEMKTGKVKPSECETCKNRKYVDGSDEMVSFKAPGHIDPKASASVVRAHEQEHVANAVREGSKPNADLISATVSLKMGVCPECGTTYVAGGNTSTTISYNENDPYDQARKIIEGSFFAGQNFDRTA